MAPVTLGIVSDIHYAGRAEQARGQDYEYRDLPNPLLRLLLRFHRHFIWLRNPLSQGHLLGKFVTQSSGCDYAIANGDYSCDTSCLGVSDGAAFESASECLSTLRDAFGGRFQGTIGDHELGKLSFIGGRGGMRLESFVRARRDLNLPPFWRLRFGRYVLLGVTSSLVAFPILERETLAHERTTWFELRAEHMDAIKSAFLELEPRDRLILFCHDPSALPFLWREEAIQQRLPQLEHTVIGHLHSNLILRQSRVLAGMPRIHFLGNTARRLSAALREARHWAPFHVRLCPSLAGIELLKDGGFCTAQIDPDGRLPARFFFHGVKR